MNIEFELPHGIAQDLSRIADSLDTIVAIMRGQHTQPIPVAIKSMPACESKAPEIEPQPSLPGAEETQTPPADTEVPAKPRKAAKHAKTNAEEAPPTVKEVTEDDVRAALVAASHVLPDGREGVLAILSQFNARKVSDVSPDNYGAIIAACDEAVGQRGVVA